MKRRKIRKYKAGRRNSGMKFLWIVGIMLLAIVCGYLTARFIIGPMLGYDTEVLKLDFPSNITSALEGNEDGTDDEDEESDENTESEESDNAQATDEKTSDSQDKYKYALQYGVFTEKERAEELVSKLEKLNIKGEILTESNKYKVISDKSETKEKAMEKLKNIPTGDVESVFITTL